MKTYHDLLRDIIDNGIEHGDRTGTGTRRVFGRMLRHDLTTGFPLLTTKKMFMRGVFEELSWFLSGSTNIADLDPCVHKWWEEFADLDGDLGPIYGEQLRNYGSGFDQIAHLVDQILTNPNSRRIVATTWNPEDVPDMKLPCCHGLVIQLAVYEDKGLSLSMYQRSADVFLGVPVNIASYALLTHMLAAVTGCWPKELVMTFGDLHLYNNHVKQANEQLSRKPFSLPTLSVNVQPMPTPDEAMDALLGIRWEDIRLDNYHHYDAIKAEMSV
jgi:thymidylate synthase